MDIKVSDNQLSTIASAAIMAQLEPGTREELVKQAITLYLNEKSNHYDSKQTRLVHLVNKAAEEAVLALAHAELKKPEHAEMLQQVIEARLAEVLTKGSKTLDDLVDTAVDRVLRSGRERIPR